MDMKRFFLYAIVIAALALAGCGGNGGTTAMPPPPPPPPGPTDAEQLTAAKTAAQTAYDAAKTAKDAAAMTFAALMDMMSADVPNYTRASDANDMAMAAYEAAKDANMKAQDATTVADAQKYRDMAQAEQEKAEAANMDVTKYATMVQNAQQAIDDEAQRVMDVAAARTAAMQSYMDADADAMKAEAAADEAEMTSPNSPGAMAARNAATAAREAANAAKVAHDAITDGMSKAEADMKAADAATQAANARSSYMMAKDENDAIQTAAGTLREQQRMRDIENAKTAAAAAVEAAMTAKTNAENAAMAAETARDDAMAAYEKAMAARTDSMKAKAEYEKAKTAAMMARTAANNADAAYMAAKMAADGIMDDGTADAAKMAQMTAEEEQGKAETAAGTADEQKMVAATAQGNAEMYAGMHVLELFKAANGAHVTDVESTEANEKEQHANNVGAAMAMVAGATDGNQAAGATNADTFTAGTAIAAAATWPGNTVDNPGTTESEFAEGDLSINLTINGGTGLPFELRASRDAIDLNGDGDMDDTGEAAITQNARKIGDLGVFDGYEIWENADATDTTREGARAIVFTNKQKGEDSKIAVSAAAARTATRVAITTPGELAKVTSTGTTITGVEWTPSGDTAPLTGTLTCPSSASCGITLGEDGAVTAISGYTFTGTRAAREEVTAANATENNNYLMFGLWLDENDDSTTDTFGTFAVGGTGYADAIAVAVTGTATYSGKAAGAHHKTGEGVNWFHGDASLTANFGTDTVAGTISGQISNIRVAGGAARSAPIYLGQTTLTPDTATFNGAAFMGEPTAPGASTHEFDGTWSGSFFGPTADDTTTTGVDESITAPLAAAGTFGVTKSMGTGSDAVVESFVGAFGAHKQ